MKTLALEMSTDVGSLALLSGYDVILERRWRESHLERQGLFMALHELSIADGVDFAEIGVIAVGVGPGSFSGLRMAITAACALAAPGGKRVVGVGSARAAAAEWLSSSPEEEVVVLGDARRQKLWAMRFRRGESWPEQQGEMVVGEMKVGEGLFVSSQTGWITADWERIGSRLEAICPRNVALERRRLIPAAREIGRLAVARLERGGRLDPLMPVYVHPATTVERPEG